MHQSNSPSPRERTWHITGPTPLHGTVEIEGAKNAVLVSIASLLLTRGTSILRRVPPSSDILHMCRLLEAVGARTTYDIAQRMLTVDTSAIHGTRFTDEFLRGMQSMRAAALLMGPLLARCGSASATDTRGCHLGQRPLDFHIRAFMQMGARTVQHDGWLELIAERLHPINCILEYPSVGTTENIMLAAALTPGITTIENAAIEPEVVDLALILQKMGARIRFVAPGIVHIEGSSELQPIEHTMSYDRLESGTFLIGAAITGGSITVPHVPAADLRLVLEKLTAMGHVITVGDDGCGISLTATPRPRAVSFRTMPFPGFPTDLQALMMVAQAVAQGTSDIMETVFENRMTHIPELHTMGARITQTSRLEAIVHGDAILQGASVRAPNIRAGAALVLAGCAARGATSITGIEHLERGYVQFPEKLRLLGAQIEVT